MDATVTIEQLLKLNYQQMIANRKLAKKTINSTHIQLFRLAPVLGCKEAIGELPSVVLLGLSTYQISPSCDAVDWLTANSAMYLSD